MFMTIRKVVLLMFKLVGVQGDAYAVMGDDGIEAIEGKDVVLLNGFGLEIAGVSVIDGKISYSDEFFIQDTSSDEDDDGLEFDEDDDYNEDDYDDYDDYDEEDETSDYGDIDEYEDEDGDEYDEEEDVYDESINSDYGDIDDYDDYEDEEESKISKLYALLTPEQVVLLKKYYLWYSQRIFTNAQKDPTLGMKDQRRLAAKKADLAQLRKTGGLWHYAGFVDGGYYGADSCTLGHTLRYTHLAWDVTVSDIDTAFFGENYTDSFEQAVQSNNCIKFGIKCISDFFEVSPECTKALQAAQREAIKDMELMYDNYTAGLANTIINSFSLMDEFIGVVKPVDAMNALMKVNKPILPSGALQFYEQFRQLRMIPPKSLIQEIRDKVCGWDNHKFTGELRIFKGFRIVNVLETLGYGKRYSIFIERLKYVINKHVHRAYSGYIYKDVAYFAYLMCYKLCGYYEYDAGIQKDEGGASRKGKTLLLTLRNEAKLYKDVEYTWKYALDVMKLENLKGIQAVHKKLPALKKDNEGYLVLEGDWDSTPEDLVGLRDRLSSSIMYNYWRYVDTADDLSRNYIRSCSGGSFSSDRYTLQDILAFLESDDLNGFVSWYRASMNEELTKLNDKEKKSREEAEAKRRKAEEARKSKRISELHTRTQVVLALGASDGCPYPSLKDFQSILSNKGVSGFEEYIELEGDYQSDIIQYILANKRDSIKDIVFSICDTLAGNKKEPSFKQSYWLNEGLKEICHLRVVKMKSEKLGILYKYNRDIFERITDWGIPSELEYIFKEGVIHKGDFSRFAGYCERNW